MAAVLLLLHLRLVCLACLAILLGLPWTVATSAEAVHRDHRMACDIVGRDILRKDPFFSELVDGWNLLSPCIGKHAICALELEFNLRAGGALGVGVHRGERTVDLPSAGRAVILSRSIDKGTYKLCTVVAFEGETPKGENYWNRTTWMIQPMLTDKQKLLFDRCRTEEFEHDRLRIDNDQTPRQLAVIAWKVLEKQVEQISGEPRGECHGVTKEECKVARESWAQEVARSDKAFAGGARKKCD
jgi:hypothetical protein